MRFEIYTILLIVAKSSRYNSSGLLLRISSGNAAITRRTHSGSSMPAEPLRQLRTVFRRWEKSALTTSEYRFRSLIGKMGCSRGTIFTTVEWTWGFGEKQLGGNLKHCCTVA